MKCSASLLEIQKILLLLDYWPHQQLQTKIDSLRINVGTADYSQLYTNLQESL